MARETTAPPAAELEGFFEGRQGGAGRSNQKGGQNLVDQAGVQLCFNYDKQTAGSECAKLGPNSTCPNGRAHKCFKCLSPAHRTRDCSKS